MPFTRNDYLNKVCTHRQYYAQFVTKSLKTHIGLRIGLSRIVASKDPHFNDITLGAWDRVMREYNMSMIPVNIWKTTIDKPTLAGLVCIAKEAASQIREESKHD